MAYRRRQRLARGVVQISLAVALLLAATGSGFANKDKAREHFKKGMAAYTLDDFDAAIIEFQNGFRQEPDAVFLYNIAQAHRMAHRPSPAIDFYRKYLKMAPAAPNRAEVEGQIDALAKTMGTPTEPMTLGTTGRGEPTRTPARVEPTPKAPEPSPTVTEPIRRTPEPTPRAVEPTPTPTPTPTVTVTVTPTVTPTPTAVEAPAAVVGKTPESPRRKSWPIAVGVVVGVVVIGGVAGTAGGIVASKDPASTLAVQNARGGGQ